jgi:hypothetical protein
METQVTQGVMVQAIDWAYEKAVNGIPGTGTAVEFADEYLKNNKNDPIAAANSLIRWQNTKAATTGFVTGLGGLVTLPVAIPANVAGVMYVQLRMIAAIAHIGGHDVKNDRSQTMMYVCLAGNAAADVLKDVGITVAQKLTVNAIKSISGATLTKINQAVGFRLLTKAGTTGVINLGKAVPVLGGIVGGAFDGITTNTVGNTARKIFIENEDRG